MKHIAYVQLSYSHNGVWPSEEAIVEVQAEDGHLLSELAKMAKEKLCSTLRVPAEEITILHYGVNHALPLIVAENPKYAPTAEMSEMRAKWTKDHDGDEYCSICSRYMPATEVTGYPSAHLYCPNCGAKMESEPSLAGHRDRTKNNP